MLSPPEDDGPVAWPHAGPSGLVVLRTGLCMALALWGSGVGS